MTCPLRVFVQWFLSTQQESIINGSIPHVYYIHLPTLAHVSRWFYIRLKPLYRRVYKEWQYDMKVYDYATAWYDALDELPSYGYSRDFKNPRWYYDMNISMLQELERSYEKMESCLFCYYNDSVDRYNFHNHGLCQNLDFIDDPWETNTDYGGCGCTIRRYPSTPPGMIHKCTCIYERRLTDYTFKNKVNKVLPHLKRIGWKLEWKSRSCMRLIAPKDRDDILDYAEELALVYYNE